jgi:hypothetical protein
MWNLQAAGHMSPAEFKSAGSPINFVSIVKSGKQFLSYNKILAYRMGRSRKLENLQWEKWEKYEVLSLAVPFTFKFRVCSNNDLYSDNFVE